MKSQFFKKWHVYFGTSYIRCCGKSEIILLKATQQHKPSDIYISWS